MIRSAKKGMMRYQTAQIRYHILHFLRLQKKKCKRGQRPAIQGRVMALELIFPVLEGSTSFSKQF